MAMATMFQMMRMRTVIAQNVLRLLVFIVCVMLNQMMTISSIYHLTICAQLTHYYIRLTERIKGQCFRFKRIPNSAVAKCSAVWNATSRSVKILLSC